MIQVRMVGENKTLTLTDELASGGMGKVYRHPDDPTLLVKILHNPDEKINLKRSVFYDSPLQVDHPRFQLALPIADVVSVPSGQVVGFVMRYGSGQPLANVVDPATRPVALQAYKSRLTLLADLAHVVEKLHLQRVVLLDGLALENILVGSQIWLIDCDGWQLTARDGVIHRAEAVYPEIRPPELAKKGVDEVTLGPESDSWGLGIVTFWLLTNHHAFSAQPTSAGCPPLATRIADGLWPYGHRAQTRGIAPHPWAPLELFHPAVQRRIVECFEAGSFDPRQRPSVAEWEGALREALADRSFLSRVGKLEKQIAKQRDTVFQTTQSGGATQSRLQTRPPTRGHALYTATALVAVSLLVALGFHFTRSPNDAQPEFDFETTSADLYDIPQTSNQPRRRMSIETLPSGKPRPTPKAWRRMTTDPVSPPRRTPTGPLSEPPSDAWRRLQDLSKEIP